MQMGSSTANGLASMCRSDFEMPLSPQEQHYKSLLIVDFLYSTSELHARFFTSTNFILYSFANFAKECNHREWFSEILFEHTFVKILHLYL